MPAMRLFATAALLVGALCVSTSSHAEEAPKAPAPKPTVEAALGKGFTLRTPDDLLSLTVRARIQVRAAVVTDPDKVSGSPVIEPEDTATQIMIRRLRLVLQGNVLGPKLTYYVQLAFSNSDTEADLRLPLRDAYVAWNAHRDIGLRVGQMKVPYGRQRVVSSGALEFADRSLIIEEMSLHRDVGVVAFSRNLFGANDAYGYQVGVFGGDGRNRLAEYPGFLWLARLDFWPNGHFDDLSEGDLQRLPKPRLAVGITAAYNQNTYRKTSVLGDTYKLGGFDYAHGSADFVFKWHGFAATGEALIRHSQTDLHEGKVDGATLKEWSRSGVGFFAQASQMLTDHVQIAARASNLVPLRATDPKFSAQHEVGFATSYYFVEHALKLQGDYTYLFGPGQADGRHVARLQFQLAL